MTMLELLIVMYVQFMIMLIELETVLSVQKLLNADNLKHGVFVCVARQPQFYRNEPYQKLWL
jgi:hypothetical protein